MGYSLSIRLAFLCFVILVFALFLPSGDAQLIRREDSRIVFRESVSFEPIECCRKCKNNPQCDGWIRIQQAPGSFLCVGITGALIDNEDGDPEDNGVIPIAGMDCYKTPITPSPTTTTTKTTTTTTTTTTTPFPPMITREIQTQADAKSCMCHENRATPTENSLTLQTSWFQWGPIRVTFRNDNDNQRWTCRSGGSDDWGGRLTGEVSRTSQNDCAGVQFPLCHMVVRFAPGPSCPDRKSQYYSAIRYSGNYYISFKTFTCPGTLYYGIWDSDSVCHTNSNSIKITTIIRYNGYS